MKYIVDIKGEIEGDYEIIGKYEDRHQGEWKVKTISTFPQYQPDEYICPFCNIIVNHKTNFCSNCGAKMNKENNNGQ